MTDKEHGPVYGVELIDTLPLPTGNMLQAMPSRADLERVQEVSERTVAAYEILLAHYRQQLKRIAALEEQLTPKPWIADATLTINDTTRGQ